MRGWGELVTGFLVIQIRISGLSGKGNRLVMVSKVRGVRIRSGTAIKIAVGTSSRVLSRINGVTVLAVSLLINAEGPHNNMCCYVAPLMCV